MVVAITEVEVMGWEEVCGKRFGYVVFEVFGWSSYRYIKIDNVQHRTY